MTIKQLSIFVENKTGRLHSIMDTLSSAGVDITALSIADTTDFGILRVIVSDIFAAREALKSIGVVSKITDVIAVYIDHKVGGLASVIDHLSDEGVSIEYMYAFLGRKEGKALMVLKVDDQQKAIKIFNSNNVKLASSDEI